MAARLIDGKKVVSQIQENLKKEISKLKKKGINPCLAVIFDGADHPSKKYVALKKRACEEVGICILIYNIRESRIQRELIILVDKLNAGPMTVAMLMHNTVLAAKLQAKSYLLECSKLNVYMENPYIQI